MTADADITATRAILTDAFTRIRDGVAGQCRGLTAAAGAHRPDPDANSIDWLVWHLTRVQDDHIADAAGTDQVWTSAGWRDRFALPFDAGATGYGQSAAEVGEVVAAAELLDGYHAAVHRATLDYLERLDAAELDRIIDTRWDPPVTVAVRLVSVIGDCMEHLGQAAYVRGLADRAGI